MNIGERIKLRRKELGKTLEDVGKIVGVSKQTIQRYESGEIANIPYDKVLLLAKALECSGADLFFNEVPRDNKYNANVAKIAAAVTNSEELQELVTAYNSLNEEQKQAVKTIIRSFVNQ